MYSLIIFVVGLITLVGVFFGPFWSVVIFCVLFILSLCYDIYAKYRSNQYYEDLWMERENERLMERENERLMEQFNKPDEEYLKDINL